MAEFQVIPVWDEEAKRWYTEGNIIGLNIETDTLEELIDLVKEFAPELIECNHPEVTAEQRPHAIRMSMDIRIAS
ncbi:MAG: DUF1902 domain-containing protein [Pseudomonadota bacterium]